MKLEKISGTFGRQPPLTENSPVSPGEVASIQMHRNNPLKQDSTLEYGGLVLVCVDDGKK